MGRVARPPVRIGISGWTHAPWRGTFYPAGLPHRRELAYAAERLTSIEVNGSFYALQKPESDKRWRAETPEHLVFSVKAPRFVTHLKRLRDVRVPDDRALTVAEDDRPLRHAVEVRHASFLDPAAIALFRARGVALVLADSAGT